MRVRLASIDDERERTNVHLRRQSHGLNDVCRRDRVHFVPVLTTGTNCCWTGRRTRPTTPGGFARPDRVFSCAPLRAVTRYCIPPRRVANDIPRRTPLPVFRAALVS